MSPQNSLHTEGNEFRRIVVIWIVLSVVLDLLYWFLVGPHVPPGRMTSTAKDNQLDFNVLFVVAFPVLVGIWEYMLYAVINWRSKKEGVPESVGGPRAAENRKLQTSWIVITTVVVLLLAAYGP